MENKRILPTLLALCLTLILCVACASSNTTPPDNIPQEPSTEKETEKIPEVNTIFLSKSELLLGIGETASLIATVSPGNVETTLSWSSSDDTVAEVNDSGVVTAKSEGTAVIKVEASNGVLNVCNVAVKIKTGSVSGTVTYKYNNYVGNRPDTGTAVLLISKSVTSLPDSIASGRTWDADECEGVYVTKVDGSGNYILPDIPVGEYYIVLISQNTALGVKAGKACWGVEVYDMFSEKGQDYADNTCYSHKVTSESISIEEEKATVFSYDFGLTYH